MRKSDGASLPGYSGFVMSNPFWEQYNGFTVEGAGPPPKICAYAGQFKQWSDALSTAIMAIAGSDNMEGIIAVNQGYVQLTKKLFDWREAVPRTHRNRVGGAGHICIFDVFIGAFYQLRTLELSLSPPPLFLPPAPQVAPPTPVFSIAGISLGEKEDEE
jgi:hypothetical protein